MGRPRATHRSGGTPDEGPASGLLRLRWRRRVGSWPSRQGQYALSLAPVKPGRVAFDCLLVARSLDESPISRIRDRANPPSSSSTEHSPTPSPPIRVKQSHG
jgi:hypothetical protein